MIYVVYETLAAEFVGIDACHDAGRVRIMHPHEFTVPDVYPDNNYYRKVFSEGEFTRYLSRSDCFMMVGAIDEDILEDR